MTARLALLDAFDGPFAAWLGDPEPWPRAAPPRLPRVVVLHR